MVLAKLFVRKDARLVQILLYARVVSLNSYLLTETLVLCVLMLQHARCVMLLTIISVQSVMMVTGLTLKTCVLLVLLTAKHAPHRPTVPFFSTQLVLLFFTFHQQSTNWQLVTMAVIIARTSTLNSALNVCMDSI